ncbi:hypothetical protein [Serinibacter arcticus]|uniref:hypothetical protein n=1 Tax=Serinibacter arcticus TaxID=1655435 RepID=UPI001091879D|nr:hypothetical protein [Serinibacter arcticus]
MGRAQDQRTTAARACAAVAVVALGLGLAACSPDPEPAPEETTTRIVEDPSTGTTTETPSPSPTETPTLTPEEENIAAAKQTVVDYYAAVDEVARGGYSTWTDKLIGYWASPDVANLNSVAFQAAADQGRRSDGATKISGFAVLEYTANPDQPGYERVHLEYCGDYTETTTYDRDGAVIPPSNLDRFTWAAILQRQEDGRWAFAELESMTDRACT